MSQKKTSVAINGLFAAGYRVLNILFPLVTSVYVARVLLPSGTGRVAYAQNVVTYFTLLASLGLPTYGTREIARNLGSEEKYNKTFFELFSINTISTTICVIAYYVLCFTLPGFREDLLLYLVAGSAIVLNYFNIDWLYQGREEYKFIAIRGLLIKALSVVLLFFVVKKPSDYVTYAGIYCLVLGGNNFVNCLGLRRRIHFTKSRLEIKRHLKPIIILFATTIAIELYTMLDTTMLGIMCSDQVVGYYSYAMKTTKIIITVLTAATTVLLPRLSSFYHESREKYNDLANKGIEFLFSVSIPIALYIYFNAYDIVVFLYSDHYAKAVESLKILALLIPFISFSTYLGIQILCSANREKDMLIAVSIGAITNVIMNAVLIPRFYQNGAAIASVGSEFLVMLCDSHFAKKIIRLHIPTKTVIMTAATSMAVLFSAFIVHGYVSSMFLRLVIVGAAMVLTYIVLSAQSIIAMKMNGNKDR